MQKSAHRMSIGPIALHVSLTASLTHVGKSASFSQAALSAINIDVDTPRLLDIVSPFTTRTHKERKSNNKENLTKIVSSAPIRKSDEKSEFIMVESTELLRNTTVNAADKTSSSATASSKKKHLRSQSQPKAAVRSGLSFHILIRHYP